MASDVVTVEERLAALRRSMQRTDVLFATADDHTAARETVPDLAEEVVALAEAEDEFWKAEPPTPEEEPEDPVRESLRLQREFFDKHGHHWWSPPADKINIRGYRPPPNKPLSHSRAVNSDGMSLTLDARCGEAAPRDVKFTPFAAICKFPYKFVAKEWMQPLATAIFDHNKIQSRDWDLYYIFSNIDCPRPCLFVAEAQFQDLLNEINECFPDAHIHVPQALRDEGLVIDFSAIDDPALRPRWLGHSSSRIQVDMWPDKVDPTTSQHDGMSKHKDVELFKQKMDQAFEMGRNKKKAARKTKQEQATVRRWAMTKELLGAQKYLGLLPEQEDEKSLLPNITRLSLSPFDPTNPAPHQHAKQPIIIAIDVEAFERPPNQITEVGVATLDTRDLKGIAPGMNGQAWKRAIRARHFRIAEYKHLVNKDYVHGCPEHFQFGESEMVGQDRIGSKLTSCFHAPFSSPHIIDETIFGPKADNQGSTVEEGEERRDIILLGHDVHNDIHYLRKIGFDPLNRGNLLEITDTRSMYQAYTHDHDSTSLGGILAAFDLAGWHLHNAGNDAVYTIWAFLAMAVASATEHGKAEVVQRRTEDLGRRETVNDGVEGREVSDGEDGGVAIGAVEDSGEDGTRGGKGKGRVNAEGFVPWQGSETGLYTAGGYPLNV